MRSPHGLWVAEGKVYFTAEADAGAHKEFKRIALGGGAAGILVQPNGAKAYVASGNGVTIIDLKTMEAADRIETGPGPDGLGWAVNE